MRKKLFEIIEPTDGYNKLSSIYDYFMIAVIIVSLLPMCVRTDYYILQIADKICMYIFIADYILRLVTADYKYQKRGVWSFVRYPFSIAAIIDLASILPSILLINNTFRLLRIVRMIKAFRVFRVFKAARYSNSVKIIINVFKKSKNALIAVLTFAIAYILISALVIYNVEPESFGTLFDAVYWATVSLTTMGYGDIYPVTTVGRVVTMLSSLFGIAIVALPSGIITAGYMDELKKDD